MEYKINRAVYVKIRSFYRNVAKKYRHTYSVENILKDTQKARESILKIENGLLRRKPTLSRRKDYLMANTDKWYFAYRIDGDTIYVEDACHSQNMHESKMDVILNLIERIERIDNIDRVL